MKPIPCLRALSIVLAAQLSAVAGPKIGVLLKDRDLFWAQVEIGALEAGRANNAELSIKAPSIPKMLSLQLKLMSALELEQMDALVIGPLSLGEEFRDSIGRLRAKGVKIVALETDLPKGLSDVFCGYNQKAMAEAAAKLFANYIKDGDEVAMLRPNALASMSRREKTLLAAMKELRPNSTVYIDVMSGIEKGDEYNQAVLLLERHPNVKALITPASVESMTMIKALKEKKMAGKVLHFGFGTGLPAEVVEAIESGATQIWIAQQPKMFGYRGVEAAVALAAGKPVPPVIDVDYSVVTKENLQDPKIQALRR
jgi:ABC-type sugar transport system substrate-binding protein